MDKGWTDTGFWATSCPTNRTQGAPKSQHYCICAVLTLRRPEDGVEDILNGVAVRAEVWRRLRRCPARETGEHYGHGGDDGEREKDEEGGGGAALRGGSDFNAPRRRWRRLRRRRRRLLTVVGMRPPQPVPMTVVTALSRGDLKEVGSFNSIRRVSLAAAHIVGRSPRSPSFIHSFIVWRLRFAYACTDKLRITVADCFRHSPSSFLRRCPIQFIFLILSNEFNAASMNNCVNF